MKHQGDTMSTTYDYDNLNRLTKVTDPSFNTTVYAYNWRDQVTQVDRSTPSCRRAVLAKMTTQLRVRSHRPVGDGNRSARLQHQVRPRCAGTLDHAVAARSRW